MINIGNIVTKQANLKANKLAVYDQPNDKRVSFSELNNMVNKIANTLLELGIGKGDRVSILSQNCVEYFALFFACAKTGAILQTLNWRLADQEISKIMSNGDPKVFIYQVRACARTNLSNMYIRSCTYIAQTGINKRNLIKKICYVLN